MALMNRPAARPTMREPREDISGMLLKKQAAQALADTQNRAKAANPPPPPPSQLAAAISGTSQNAPPPAQNTRMPPPGGMPPRPPGMKEGGKVGKWEGSAEDETQDKKLAKKHGMSMSKWEKSKMDEKHDKQQSMKGLKKGGGVESKGKTKGKTVKMCGGGMKGYAKGGVIRGGGCESKGKTKGKMR